MLTKYDRQKINNSAKHVTHILMFSFLVRCRPDNKQLWAACGIQARRCAPLQ